MFHTKTKEASIQWTIEERSVFETCRTTIQIAQTKQRETIR